MQQLPPDHDAQEDDGDEGEIEQKALGRGQAKPAHEGQLDEIDEEKKTRANADEFHLRKLTGEEVKLKHGAGRIGQGGGDAREATSGEAESAGVSETTKEIGRELPDQLQRRHEQNEAANDGLGEVLRHALEEEKSNHDADERGREELPNRSPRGVLAKHGIHAEVRHDQHGQEHPDRFFPKKLGHDEDRDEAQPRKPRLPQAHAKRRERDEDPSGGAVNHALFFSKSARDSSRLSLGARIRYKSRPVMRLALLPLLFLLCQCGTPSAPRCFFVPREARAPAETLLDEARIAWTELERRSSPAALARYNAATSKLFLKLHCGAAELDAKAAKIGTAIDRTHTIGTGLHLSDLEALVPASRVELKKMGERHRDPGMGVPVVGWKSAKATSERRFKFAPPTGIPLNLTAVLDFDHNPPLWRFLYAGRTPRLKLGRRSEPLAVDWSAPAALYWRMSDLDDADLAKVFLPTRFTDHAGLFFATPYAEEKIPVVFVHGLNSSPGTYKTLYNDLVGQEWFREKYQVLFFSYPTGIAWPYNAAAFRQQLHAAREYARSKGSLTQWNKMVVVGHSMGGVISRASLINPGERFYDASYNRPLDELRVSNSTRKAIESVRLYQPLQSPSRAIFMAAPHRGSPLADRRLVHWISSIVRLPKTLTIDLATATLDEISKAIQQGGQTRPPLTSFGTLTPQYKAYGAINASPFRPNLTFHSVIGDRGKGNGVKSSDGIVPYWSSHLEGAASEKIVPAGHSLADHPETIREVSRILQLHLKSQ